LQLYDKIILNLSSTSFNPKFTRVSKNYGYSSTIIYISSEDYSSSIVMSARCSRKNTIFTILDKSNFLEFTLKLFDGLDDFVYIDFVDFNDKTDCRSLDLLYEPPILYEPPLILLSALF